MAFHSTLFLFTCLPVMLVCYRLVKQRFKNLCLLVFSLLFYAWGEPLYVFLMIASILYVYVTAQLLQDQEVSKEKQKRLFLLAVTIHLFVLIYLKYYGFVLDSISAVCSISISYDLLPVPLGISFYTFSMLSYLIDVYQRRIEASHHLIDFGVYASFFPKLLMGPIERYSHMKKQLCQHPADLSQFSYGVERFIQGLAKKLIIADTFGLLYQEIAALPMQEISMAVSWIMALAYMMQIYFDFSGYSDMAVGLGRMFGFHLSENFNYPYLSKSITEFWRRWHISLSSWFRDYVYIPLGGNRVSRKLQIRNLMIVWLLTGIWHGASWNFLLWGLYYGILLLLEKHVFGKWQKQWKPVLQWLLTMLFICFGWVLFSHPWEELPDLIFIMSGFGAYALIDDRAIWYVMNYGVLFLLSLAIALPYGKSMGKKLLDKLRWKEQLSSIWYLILFLITVAFLISQSYQSFLYAQF